LILKKKQKHVFDGNPVLKCHFKVVTFREDCLMIAELYIEHYIISITQLDFMKFAASMNHYIEQHDQRMNHSSVALQNEISVHFHFSSILINTCSLRNASLNIVKGLYLHRQISVSLKQLQNRTCSCCFCVYCFTMFTHHMKVPWVYLPQ
jgi:hypothetical protein